ncbi:carboxylesterase family protein [Corynebacterium sp. zg254]|uniref:Carboxylesterase family protein n=2 Tax=Corynebacteriaceae TaxID=1653 RepID=A0ABQ6VDC1_9CORY|nr:carboxylesterase family protein [Corynebacterium zhongnanshanii]MCR5914542.1 carboxylesterase family protein [Corynebacterium sp. zg254]
MKRMNNPRCIPSPSLDVRTTSGVARGWRGPVAAHWSCIPYARQPETMRDRFSDPVPYVSDELFDACLPNPIPLHEEKNHTDLTLSVCAPAERAEGCPVVVYLHGGRFEHGHADEPIYRGDSFARDGVVYVTMNYRKRFDGFLPSQIPDTAAEADPKYAPEFRGVQDVLCALRWVQKNIAAFGGDPTKVLAMGQSAGGGLLSMVLTRPEVTEESLIHRAMIMSPGLPRSGWAKRGPVAEKMLRSASNNKNKKEELSEEELTEAYRTFARRYSRDIAAGPYPLHARRMADIPLLVTGLEAEFDQFPLAKWADQKAQEGSVGQRLMAKGVKLVAAKAVGAPLKAVDPEHSAGRAIGNSTILRFMSQILERRRDAQAAGAQAPQWALLYRSGEVDPGSDFVPVAGHCADIPLVFDALKSNPGFSTMFCGKNSVEGLQPVADELHRLVVGFARGNDLPWEPYERQGTRTVREVFLSDRHSEDARDSLRFIREHYPPIPADEQA